MNKSGETIPPLPEAPAAEGLRAKYLSYQDAPLPEEQKRRVLESTASSGSAARYESSLSQMIASGSEERVLEFEEGIRTHVLEVLQEMGIEPSPYTRSKTWALWDLAKQNHIFENDRSGVRQPFSTEGYAMAPWDSLEKQTEIEDRHLGWEIYMNRNADVVQKLLARIKDTSVSQEMRNLLSMLPKGNGTLSSKDLARLGELTLRAWDEPAE